MIDFNANADKALADPVLQSALAHVRSRFIDKRKKAIAALPEFEALRDYAKAIKDHTLSHLGHYLDEFQTQAQASGAKVHRASDRRAAQAIILDICKKHNARLVTKGKSMVGEEIQVNKALEEAGIRPIETDLGEYIVQLRKERPSHLIAPAVHVPKREVEKIFRATHTHLSPLRDLTAPESLLAEARLLLREQFLKADIGITGANFLIAETGSMVLVTNEGNGDLTHSLPRVHIVLASIEKIVPRLKDAAALLRLLARSATGQEMSVYTSFVTGPKRATDADGPQEMHIIVLDNGRSELLGTEFQDILRCIKCGACLNHCPIYHAVGGHAYESVYAGPIGAALSPVLMGLEATADLPEASSLCGRCEEVCPVRIPLPSLLRKWRNHAKGKRPFTERLVFRLWAWTALRPTLYRLLLAGMSRLLALLAGRKQRIRYLPMAWFRHHTLAVGKRSFFEIHDDAA